MRPGAGRDQGSVRLRDFQENRGMAESGASMACAMSNIV